ncbi:MAG: restriction endonuclease [Syntrophobacterales bacterium]|nr:restriction endonuclease [Syntrophobacterales bacterium]
MCRAVNGQNTNKGIFVTTSFFSGEAIKSAKKLTPQLF